MAILLRSIGTKIFTIALGLIVMMLLASWWSAASVNRVNYQLRTLSESLMPLALSVQDLRHVIGDERLALVDPDRDCRDALAAGARTAALRLDDARRRVARGQQVAIKERNRIELARMLPLVDELDSLHDRFHASATRACAAPGNAEAKRDSEADAHALDRKIDAVADEIQRFTIEGAGLVEARERGAMRANAALIGVVSIVALFLAWLVTRGLTRPIARLREGARAVQSGRLDAAVRVTTRDEVGEVTEAFNEMLVGLRARDRIQKTFGQYVDPRVVAQLVADDAAPAPGGRRDVATLFFSDIAGFTALSETLSPSAVVEIVNEYFATMSEPIRAEDGVIDKFIGDSIMAFWMPPFVDAGEQALRACRAALAQRDLVEAFNRRLPDLLGRRRDVPRIDLRMAVATGEVVVGSIGPAFARSFTVMGDTVNLASRLEGANKLYGTRIIIDAATRERVGDAVVARPLDMMQVGGRVAPQEIHELIGLAGDLPESRREVIATYAEALDLYRAGRWPDAAARFADALALDPEDRPSAAMIARIRAAGGEAPADWTGVWRSATK